jgi:hypothetical protein
MIAFCFCFCLGDLVLLGEYSESELYPARPERERERERERKANSDLLTYSDSVIHIATQPFIFASFILLRRPPDLTERDFTSV